ncbi:adenylate/guanylate cyclase domain-containing protein [Arenibacter sp. N53]|uniref:adenylate/guanylate cyclase domain-containing protein n=1 Tax=Arenibacter TaxID=178469 RepID=UPI000CD3C6A8|nr:MULTISPECIES: adenylate/guanylate cyclase domain-containing protein [Arenibacter]MCM4151498.1 adenylate/guanylate cyclase domain-containing protein [Arenibacter sp. N53]
MKFTLENERGRYAIIYVTMAGLVLGLFYPLVANGFARPIAYVHGVSIGLIGGFLVGVIEFYAFKPKNRKFSFLITVITKSTVYSLLFIFLIVLLINFNESWYYNTNMIENFYSQRFQTFLYEGDFKVIVLYSLFSVIIIIFTREMSRKMGQGVFVNFLTGKYHSPCEEERIFMFLDQKSSTPLAEKMGSLGYYKFLKEFYFDVTKCIVANYGEIYRYVGDQVVISWSVKNGLKNANCIRCYYNVKNETEKQREKYLHKYRRVPKFRASLHMGKVIRGEVGNVKSQIVFHGEALYETAFIEKECQKLGLDILVSEPLLKRINLPVIYKKKQVGGIPVLGKDKPIKLFAVEETVLQPL